MIREYYHRHLPHWQPTGAIFFVTFRLKGTLPVEAIQALKEERAQEKKNIAKFPKSEQAKQNYADDSRYFGKWDNLLDKAEFGRRWLSEPEIAEILKEALHYRDRKVFDLYAFCIMSNHAHVVFEPCKSDGKSDWQSDLPSDLPLPLEKIMHSLKRQTARKSNIVLGRQGAFWQDESYDHVIRDNGEFKRIIHYVLENPVKAGLVSKWDDWRWTYCKSIELK